jgi:single-strand DNA-binding protein
VSFIRVVVWGRRAEVCGEYLSKGSPVFVEGRLQSRDWQTQDGQKRSAIEVVADNVQFLRSGVKQGAAENERPRPAPSSAEEVGTIDLNEENLAPPAESEKAVTGDGEEPPF